MHGGTFISKFGEHERNKIHRDSADAYVTTCRLKGQMQKALWQASIVDVVKVIGKCGLSYGGDRAEAAYTQSIMTAF